MTLGDAIQRFYRHLLMNERSSETLRSYRIELNNFCRFLDLQYNGPAYLEDITVQDLEDFLHELKQKGSNPSRRSRMVYIWRSFYNFACRQDFVAVNVAMRIDPVRVPQKERTYITEEEFHRLVPAIEHPLVRVLVITLFMTGLRIKEALSLTLDDVDFDYALIRVRHGKGNKYRVIPMNIKLLNILSLYLKEIRPVSDSTFFFATKATGKLSPDTANRVLAQSVRRLGWKKKITCHILRHSFASHLVKKNVNIVRVQKLLGHASLKTTSIYTHASLDELAEAVNTF